MKPILTFEAVADWADKQNGPSHYDYDDSFNCACANYARDMGLFDQWLLGGARGKQFWARIDGLAAQRPRTYQSFARRLRNAAVIRDKVKGARREVL